MKNFAIKPCAAAIAAAMLTTPFAAVADDAGLPEHMVVTGSRMPTDVNQLIAQVEVIERADIVAMQAKSIADVLAPIAGVEIAQLGGDGQVTSIYTRGTNTNHTLILVDGIRVGSATLGYKGLSSIPVNQIERIELLKGPRAALWGSDALGGVIHIFTRQLDAGEYDATVEFGSDNYHAATAAVGVGYQGGSSTLAVSYQESDGFDVRDDGETDDDGYDRWSIALRGDYQLNNAVALDWTAQLDDGSADSDSFSENNYQDYRNHLLRLRTKYTAGKFDSELTISQSRDFSEDFYTYYDWLTFEPISDSARFETRRTQLSGLSQYQATDSLTLTVGADAYRDEVDSSNTYTVDERDTWATYGYLVFDQNNWLFEGALRYDDVEDIDSEVTYNASAGYRVTPNLMLGASAGHAFKAPTINDLYYPDTFGSAGNPDLVSETSDSYELLAQGVWPDISVNASIYRTEIDDLIEWQCTADYSSCSPQNINSVTIEGGELIVAGHWLGLHHQIDLTYIDATDDATGRQLDRRAHKTANYQAQYSWRDVSLVLNVMHVGDRREQGTELQAYETIDLAMSYNLAKRWTLAAKADNLLDEDYQNGLGYFTPGAQYFISLEYKNN
ncbi:TonB-dependent receptor [Neiella marina]|uniref:TonB-dependent receptor n=1 Tax=Neiella holothuriorum TaxID=2870530 RepID=A0ABS7ED44_9GAMM|nr:TonB-dependent receptor [Neiella holothuriorum]MBW8190266.1 TonB-dependent receptor [Neiella holothuriorum]